MPAVASAAVLGWAAAGQVGPAEYPNDLGLHLSLSRLAAQRMAEGHIPFDGWYAPLSLGSPMLHQYQTLPHVIVGLIGQVTDLTAAFRWSTVVLLTLWPLATYAGARLLGLPRLAASSAAVLAPLLRSEFGYGLEPSGASWAGLGLWPQLWATSLLPIALGLSWRAVARPTIAGAPPAAGPASRRALLLRWRDIGAGSVVVAGIVTGFVSAFHNVSGVVALLAVAAWVAAAGRPALSRALPRAGLVVVAAVGAMLWVIVPTALDGASANRPGLDRPTIDYVHHGPGRLVGWLVTGELLEAGRLPLLTIAAALGMAAAFRRGGSQAARGIAILGLGCLAAMAAPGLPVVGELLPGEPDLYLRLIIGVHTAGVLLAGVGIAWVATASAALLREWRPSRGRALAPALLLAATGTAAAIGLADVAGSLRDQSTLLAQQHAADQADGADLLALLSRSASDGGRVFGGSATGWGPSYRIGFVPVYAVLANHDIESIGFWFRTSSLSTVVEPLFDEHRPAHYDVFDVRYVVAPIGRTPQVPAEEIDRQGRHVLYRVAGRGRAAPVTVAGSVVADAGNIGERMRPFLGSPLPEADAHPRLVLDRGAPAVADLPPAPAVASMPGTARMVRADPTGGRYDVEVDLQRPGAVLLKSSYHPRWQVRVDGISRRAEALAPSMVGVSVTPGRHLVTFEYAPIRYGRLVLLSVLVVAAAAAPPRRMVLGGLRRLPTAIKWASRSPRP